jgi:AraC-like DNA-binding protein
MTKLYIKNMVSPRCIMAVQAEIAKLDLHCSHIELGEAEIDETLTPRERRLLAKHLNGWGFELLNDGKAILVERIKNLVIGSVHYDEPASGTKFSVYLSDALHHDYTYLANVFSAATASSIRDYIINQKIERAKEMIAYDDLPLAAIAHSLHYCSLAHFSSQFKDVTGYTPSDFRSLEHKPLRELENV